MSISTFQKYTLKVYIIHDETLKFREANMNNTLKILRVACNSFGMNFRPIMITQPNIETLQKNIQTLQTKVKYEKINDDDFDNRMSILSIEQISNIEKHKEAWNRILNDEDTNVIPLIIEDDAFFMNDFTNNLIELLQSLPFTFLSPKRQWDICFLGNTQRTDNYLSNKLEYASTRGIAKILPSKESYIITPSIIRRLINSLDTMRYIMRIHLSWFVHTNQDIRSVFPSKPIFLDGSKIGVCTSTIHPMNPLVLNREFMELWQLQNKPEITITQIRSLFKKIEHMKSPDILHLFGRLLIEKKQYDDAEDAFTEAIKLMRVQHGLLNPGSQLLSDTINNYKNLQKDVVELSKKSPKYVEPDIDS